MGKRSRATHAAVDRPAGEPGPRQPCPCGSGRRYKHCHGSPGGPPPTFVARPFAGLRSEGDLVAMREFVPAATAPAPLADSVETDRSVLLCTLLPMAAPALVRPDGTVWVGLQVQHAFGDPSRELAAVLLQALDADPGETVGLTADPGEGPRLQDVLADEALTVTVHDGFDFWVADVEDASGVTEAALERANSVATPTAKLGSVASAYWTDVGTKEHLRWVMPHEEDRLLDALARVHAAGQDALVPDSRLVGMFRAHGLLVPVWDLPPGTGPEALEEPAAALESRLASALAEAGPLGPEERAARSGLANRQVTLR